MVKKLGLRAFRIVLILYFWIVFYHFLGGNALILVVLTLLVTGALLQRWRKMRIEREIDKVFKEDKRPIRFDGNSEQVSLATQIGEAHGWGAESVIHDDPQLNSVRLVPQHGCSSPTVLLNALFDARIAESVKP